MTDTGDITIRRATTRDARTLARLRFEFRTGLHEPVETERAFYRRVVPWMSREMRARRWAAWLAERSNEAIGCVWMFRMPKLPNPGGEPEMHAYVSNFYVREDARGRGVGSRLLHAVVETCEAEGVDSIILWPTERSKPLYLRHGFRVPTLILDRPVSAHFSGKLP